MANQYFQFKQFRVEQSLAAMKVCTEACVFAALAQYESPNRILDIGSGTGVLSLMLAQKFNCPIDAVEMEQQAFLQTRINFANSPWDHRLRIYHARIQDYFKTTRGKYDLIVSNPPFFTNHLQANSPTKNLAIHNDFLTQEDLIRATKDLLSAGGNLYLLLPPSEAINFDKKAEENGLFLQKRIILLNRPDTKPFRFLSWYGFRQQQERASEFIIRNADGTYSHEFIAFLKPYYLNL